MTKTFKLFLAGTIAAMAATGALGTNAALAADLLPPPPEPLPEVYVPSYGSWYLRGDVGLGITSGGDWHQADVTAAHGRFIEEDLGDTFFVGGGIGYKFNNWLRADFTAEYRGTLDVDGIDEYKFTCTFSGGSCGDVGDVIKRNNVWNGSISSTVLLVNAYADLGSYAGLTPFIGGGIGAAYNRFSAGVEFDTSDLGGGGRVGANGEWSFAWALMGGLGYQVNDRLALELGYRYMNLGDVETGDVVCLNHVHCVLDPLKIDNIYSHDIRLGMRWHFGGAEPVYIPEEPLLVKY